jgi:hypothetical protein
MSSGKLRIYFTIDTETSMGGAWSNPDFGPLPLARTVFGENGSGNYGIPLIMDILEEYGFQGTFFTEVFCGYTVGFEEVARVFRYIEKRGHDPQLHLHPEQRFFAEYQRGGRRREQGFLFQFPAAEQQELIADGVRLFRELCGKPPKAFRAGCYAASEESLAALPENGVSIDSSYNLAFLGRSCGFQQRLLNAPRILEGVSEFPVTNFQVPGEGYKPLEISAVSVWEMLAAIRALQRVGCRDVVLVLHSFSLLKNRGVRFENCRPSRVVISRLRRICEALSQMRDEIEVRVLSEAPVLLPGTDPGVIPSVGWFRPAIRKAVQGLDNISWF